MTPEAYQRAKHLFLQAIEVQSEERDAFVIANCNGDEGLLSEVRSLLKHHHPASLIETMELSSQIADTRAGSHADTQRSVDAAQSDEGAERETLDVNAHQPSGQELVTAADIGDGESLADLQARLDITTRVILRVRLMIATAVLIAVMIAIRIGVFLFDYPIEGWLVRGWLLVFLSVIYGVLRFNQSLTLRSIRVLSVILTAVPMLDLMLVQVCESERLAGSSQPEQVLVLTATLSLAVSLLIGLYATFLPAPWRRTAIVTGCMACAPLAVGWIHGMTSDTMAGIRIINFASPMLTMLVAAVATAGAHFVHRLRLEAEDARMYGQYRLGEEVGRGGMGVVYRAKHRMLKRPAAIKLIRAESAAKQEAIEQFEHEVQVSATLTHWNTVQIYDYGRTPSGDFYLVMEYLQGQTLGERLVSAGRLSEQETIQITNQLCDGLSEAHARGMVHRDLKPANIFLANVGGVRDVVKIVDFGLAVESSEVNEAGKSVCGTPGFMSPEQIRGEAVDPRSDIYAIGCILINCVTGHQTFPPGPLNEVLSNHLFKVPTLGEVERLAPSLSPVIQQCLQKDRKKRPANVDAIRRMLQCDEFSGE